MAITEHRLVWGVGCVPSQGSRTLHTSFVGTTVLQVSSLCVFFLEVFLPCSDIKESLCASTARIHILFLMQCLHTHSFESHVPAPAPPLGSCAPEGPERELAGCRKGLVDMTPSFHEFVRAWRCRSLLRIWFVLCLFRERCWKLSRRIAVATLCHEMLVAARSNQSFSFAYAPLLLIIWVAPM